MLLLDASASLSRVEHSRVHPSSKVSGRYSSDLDLKEQAFVSTTESEPNGFNVRRRAQGNGIVHLEQEQRGRDAKQLSAGEGAILIAFKGKDQSGVVLWAHLFQG